MLRSLRNVFLKGLFTILPVAITVYLVVWLTMAFERLFGAVLEYLLPTGTYVPGMGLALAVVTIFLVGLMLQLWFTRQLWQWGEALLDRMPLVRQIFGAIKQIVDYVSGAETPTANRVVIVTLGDPRIRMLGLVTREDLEFLDEHAGQQEEGTVAVFLPWSYQIGGFTVFVPRSCVSPIDLSAQEALRLAMTAGVTKSGPR